VSIFGTRISLIAEGAFSPSYQTRGRTPTERPLHGSRPSGYVNERDLPEQWRRL